MDKNKKTDKQASRENYFALKSGYVQHTTHIPLNADPFKKKPYETSGEIIQVLWKLKKEGVFRFKVKI